MRRDTYTGWRRANELYAPGADGVQRGVRLLHHSVHPRRRPEHTTRSCASRGRPHCLRRLQRGGTDRGAYRVVRARPRSACDLARVAADARRPSEPVDVSTELTRADGLQRGDHRSHCAEWSLLHRISTSRYKTRATDSCARCDGLTRWTTINVLSTSFASGCQTPESGQIW